MKSRVNIVAVVFLVLGSWLSYSVTEPVCAADRIVLTSEIKDRLIALKKISGPPLDWTAFKDKPVLVSFFASW